MRYEILKKRYDELKRKNIKTLDENYRLEVENRKLRREIKKLKNKMMEVWYVLFKHSWQKYQQKLVRTIWKLLLVSKKSKQVKI